MGVMKDLTVVLVAVFLSSVRGENLHATGWCCQARENVSSGCPGISTGYIQLNINVKNNTETIWKTRVLTCHSESTIVYYDKTKYIYLFVEEQNEMTLAYSPSGVFDKITRDYCFEDDGEEYRVAVCQPTSVRTCDSGVCVPKCCGEGEVIEYGFRCTRRNESLRPQFHSISGDPLTTPSSVVTLPDSMPDCEATGGFPTIWKEKEFNLLLNGKLRDTENHIDRDFHQYCIENSYTDEGVEQWAMVCSGTDPIAITIKYDLMRAGHIISDVFIIITIVFYIFIPSLRDTQGQILLSHMVSMFVALATLLVLSVFPKVISSTFCILGGFVFQYSFLAMFFWLNIMCFDIWRVIRATAKGIPLLGILNDDAKKFQLYCLYGWGFPLVIVIVTAIMHFLPEDYAKGITRPGFGTQTCWLPGDLEHLIYCYAYVAALFILDILFIGHTIIMLYQAGSAFTCFARQVTVTAFNRKHLEAFWQRFSVFILMVFCWTTEILSWKIEPQEIWIVPDFINSLQGFVLFLIFIGSRKRRGMVKELFQKAIIGCRRLSNRGLPITSTSLVTWNAASPSGSQSGPSGSTDAESSSKTDTRENN